jgi:sacsin
MHSVLIKWNRLLFNHYIPQGWVYLLKTLAEEASCNDIFSAWPPYCSSITSGDGIYWQDILPRTFRIVVEAELKVWPKVSSEGSRTYVDLKSSLIVAQGQVDADVLAVLAALGLTLV